jgi:hypothetical protein
MEPQGSGLKTSMCSVVQSSYLYPLGEEDAVAVNVGAFHLRPGMDIGWRPSDLAVLDEERGGEAEQKSGRGES